MRAVITVIGKDMVGILARVSAVCAQHNANIMDVTQSIMQDLFTMIMIVDISNMSEPLSQLSDTMTALGDEIGVRIHVMHESVFNSMHHI